MYAYYQQLCIGIRICLFEYGVDIKMTQEEFKILWSREAGSQPGMMLEVQQLKDITFGQKYT